MRLSSATVAASLLACALACGCSRPKPEAPPPAPVSAFQEEDAKAVAAELMDAAVAMPWVSQFADRNGRPPAVRVGVVEDASGDHVDVGAFQTALARRLAASDKIRTGADKADFELAGRIGMKPGTKDGKPVKYFQIDLRLVPLAGGDPVGPLSLERPCADRPAPASATAAAPAK